MEKLKKFLNLRELGEYLSYDYAEAFYEVFGFISFVSIMLFVVWSLQFLPPFRGFVRAIRVSIDNPFSESFLIREMVPNQRLRLTLYRLLMWGCVFCMCAAYITSFYYSSACVAAILAENIIGNRYSAAFVLGALSSFMFFCAFYYMKEANKIARYLHEVRA